MLSIVQPVFSDIIAKVGVGAPSYLMKYLGLLSPDGFRYSESL
jgi:hypothetical protein